MRKLNLVVLLAVLSLLISQLAFPTTPTDQAVETNATRELQQANTKLVKLEYGTVNINSMKSTYDRLAIHHTSSWKTYSNRRFGIEFKFPPGGNLELNHSANALEVRVNLPFKPGTLLTEKYLIFRASHQASYLDFSIRDIGCEQQSVKVNGTRLEKLLFSEGAAGSVYDSVNYFTHAGRFYYSLRFILHSTNPYVYNNPPPDFDHHKEAKVFSEILSTLCITNEPRGVI